MCCSTVLNETELNSICLDEEQAEIMTGGFALSGCPTPQQRHQATPHIRVAFTLNHTVALQELAWQKVTRSCQEQCPDLLAVSQAAGGCFAPGAFLEAPFQVSVLALRASAHLICSRHAARRTSARQPRAAPSNAFEEQRHTFGRTIQLSFIGFAHSKLLLWAAKFG